MRLLFVAHRYYPYPGGTEYNMQAMAEECLRRGHDVTVLAGLHRGDQNGVKVTANRYILAKRFDLSIVHGGDCVTQDFIHKNSFFIEKVIRNKILYLIILPSESPACIKGLRNASFLGYSTSFDHAHIEKYNAGHKARLVRYGIVKEGSFGIPGFKTKYAIKAKKMFISTGGYYPNKNMQELSDIFLKERIKDAMLVIMGYGCYHLAPKESEYIRVLKDVPRQDVLNAIAEADLYIMNSTSEGFGLVLLEAMLNKTPWIARDIAGAHDMKEYGEVYSNRIELLWLLRNFKRDEEKIARAYDYVINNHLIAHTADDIKDILNENRK